MHTAGSCAVCGSAWEEKTITIALPSSFSGYAVVRNVPAEVCPGCGEVLFSLQTTGRLMAVVRSRVPHDTVTIPIYDLERST